MSLESKLLAKLGDPAEMASVWDRGLRADVFEEPMMRLAYEFIVDYWQTSQMKAVPTPYVIETEIPGLRLEDDPEVESWWLADKLRERYAKNAGQELLIAGSAAIAEDPEKGLKQLLAAVYDATETISPRYARSDMSDFEARRLRYQMREENGEAGIGFGIPEIDEITGGVRPGEIAAVGAYSKVGKTMLLLFAAAEARKAGYKPVVFSLEMAIAEIEERLDALLSGVSYSRLSRHKLTPHEIDRLHITQQQVADMGPLCIESPDEGDRTVAHLCARTRHLGADVMLIDQLSFMEETVKCVSEKQRLASILKQLKTEVSREARGKIPCFLACQFTRESLDHDDGPVMKDFADAAEVERTCDLLIGLSRNQQQRANRTMRFDIMGGRRCDTAKFLLHWDLIDRSYIAVMDRITK
jgi:replicative DNA helicase